MADASGKHALWYVPSGGTYERLRAIILRLSIRYDTPPFEPHVTIIGGLRGTREELFSKSALIASVIKPHKILLPEIGCLDEFYRCLFLKGEKTPELMKTNLEAERVFERAAESEYMPHLSLMYCDFSPEAKEEIIPEIREWDRGFGVDRIHLFSTDGEPPDWKRVESFQLGGK